LQALKPAAPFAQGNEASRSRAPRQPARCFRW